MSEASSTWVLVGLGNPGKEYEGHRHNVGFQSLDYLADQYRISYKKHPQSNSLVSKYENLHFIKPQTFMNLSGHSVSQYCQFIKNISIENIIVIHDELDISFGKIQLKKGGGLAGHNGLKSIAQQLGKSDFLRIRIGIGRPIHNQSVSDYVLNNFTSTESKQLNQIYQRVYESTQSIIQKGILKAMNEFNT